MIRFNPIVFQPLTVAVTRCLLACTLSAVIACNTDNGPHTFSDRDRAEIQRIARDLPLVLTNDGWDAYEQHFTDDYQNWSMMRDRVRTREEFLGLVKNWYDQGNRATDSKIQSIEFIPLSNDLVLYLHAQQEEFNDPDTPDTILVRDIRFVSVYERIEGKWMNRFSAFMDKPR